jgi:adenine-specific DNA-methyltransferase
MAKSGKAKGDTNSAGTEENGSSSGPEARQVLQGGPEPFDLRSHTVAEERKGELLRLFPEARTEGEKVDFNRLKLALGDSVDVGKERYGLTWPGKADCFRAIQTPSLGTLLPAPAESVNWDSTENMIIEGDNLEVLKLLQKSYLGKVKMIYIDPPYNSGNDFIYPDNYAESLQTYLEYTGQVDSQGKKFSTNTDTEGRFHSKWLNMMYPRLYLARNLLAEDGVLFVSIDDNELENLHRILVEMFGEENFVACLPTVMNLKGNQDEFAFAGTHEYTLVFARDRSKARFGEFSSTDEEIEQWDEDDYGPFKQGASLKATGKNAPRERRPNLFFPIYVGRDGRVTVERQAPEDLEVYPRTDGREMSWRWSKDRFRTQPHDIIVSREGQQVSIYKKQRPTIGDLPSKKPKTLLYKPEYSSGNGTNAVKELFGQKLFEAPPKPPELIKDLVEVGCDTDGVVLDFFAGSGTTAQAVMELNRRDCGKRSFVLVQLPEPLSSEDETQKAGALFCDSIQKPRNLAELTKERVRRVIGRMANGDTNTSLLGFRVFKLGESNFKVWDSARPDHPDALQRRLTDHVHHIREGRSEQDLLTELLLKSGFPPTVSVQEVLVAEKKAFVVGDGELLICLDRHLTLEAIRAIADLRPERVVCLDEGFEGDDQLKVNAAQTFKTKGVTSFQTV